jgi:hypothetical protein
LLLQQCKGLFILSAGLPHPVRLTRRFLSGLEGAFSSFNQNDVPVALQLHELRVLSPLRRGLHVLLHLRREFAGHDPAVLVEIGSPVQPSDQCRYKGALARSTSDRLLFLSRREDLDGSFFRIIFGRQTAFE